MKAICKVWKDKTPRLEQEVYLKLKQGNDDKVILIAVDTNGNEVPGGMILCIDSRGVYLYPTLNDELGIRVCVGSDGPVYIRNPGN